jgi:hypothetical protein
LEVKAVRGYYIKRLQEVAAEPRGVTSPLDELKRGNRRCLIEKLYMTPPTALRML